MRTNTAVLLVVLMVGAAGPSAERCCADAFELNKGDHVALVGNTLAERMQHDGSLETLIQSHFPDRELVFRNLGYSADELTTRLRVKGFGSQDEWLQRVRADAVFAFFGFNESFDGPEGLDEFKQNLADFIEGVRSQKYNGETAPRLVLFSPIAHEHLDDPNLPEGSANNERLRMYAQALADVAEEHGVRFVNLFASSRTLYRDSEQALTMNGVHLNGYGNRRIATVIDNALFGGRDEAVDWSRLKPLRQAVLDKNFYWFHRYRTTDGYNVYGGRSHLKYTQGKRSRGYDKGLSNRKVLQREMEVLDVMAANRDQRIWEVARSLSKGKPLNDGLPEVDDGNTPPFIPVETNKPGPLKGGKHEYLGGEEVIDTMDVAEGMQVNLFASEEMFPEVINPVQMAWDTQGRLWVGAWPSYPHWKPKTEMDDKLLILEDTDGDGRADTCETFADGLHNPTGFEFWNGGIVVAMAPDILFLKDTDGDDRADVRKRILHGISAGDTHHTANSFELGPGGALYFQEGVFHRTQIETPYGPVRNRDACVWRFEPRTWKVDRYIPYNFANPHGHVFDRWGQDFVHDGTGAVPFHATLFSGHLDFPAKHPKPPVLYQRRTRPCPGSEILSSRHFPEENQGNLLVPNVIGFQGILQYRIEENGASYVGKEVEPILSSSDPNFRPVDVEIGPDGAIYFTDWQNPVIGHMQHHLRDPSRDKTHGRVYRITYPDRPLLEPAQIAGQPVEKLLDLLKRHENRVRYRARIELSGRDTEKVMAAVDRWIETLDEGDSACEHHLLEALWLHQSHNVVDVALLDRMLEASDHRARAAATRVLCYGRERVPNSLARLKKLAADEHPLVRLEAVRAASFYEVPEAIEVPIISTEYPTDKYLDYTRQETMKALRPFWERALAEGRDMNFTSEAGRRYFLQNVNTDQLLAMKRTAGVYREMLYRDGLREEYRKEAVRGLAMLENKSELRVLLQAIRNLDEKQQGTNAVYDLVRLLTNRDPQALAGVRDELQTMATEASLPVVRQIGFVALISADQGIEKAWKLGTRSVARLRDLVGAMPLIPDSNVRAQLYPKIKPLLEGLPENLASSKATTQGTYGRYVRIELPNRGTLTLAEVEVSSDGVNIARRGRASQKNTAHGGKASRAIDGNKKGSYGAGGQTHTERNTSNPWWELDLGEEAPVESVVVYNRTDGNLGKRLDGFTLTILDNSRHKVFKKTDLPAPKVKAEIDVGGGGAQGVVRRAAMRALTFVRGRETETFEALVPFVREGVDRIAAVRALQRIPRSYWSQDRAEPLLEDLIAWIGRIPVSERTSRAALDALQLGDSLASLLPAEKAKAYRERLGELGVRVVRIGTVPHRMSYDRARFAVSTGRPVEIVFENADLMPHNFVITEPGALKEVGLLAEKTARDPGAAERDYVPPSERILLASRLLQPRESQSLSYEAPQKPGVYPFVCTYPGHWRRMYGAMYVVDDLEAYRADPEGYLASHPLEVRDELLEFNRPRREWTFDELAGGLDELNGRSFSNGKRMFRVANCVACHKLNGAGEEFGPDLAKLDPEKKGPADILKDILEPSSKINEKFQTETLLTASGKVVTGLVVEETPKEVTIVEDPLAGSPPVVLEASQIQARRKASESIMPKGLLDRLRREEILDLLAYIVARGDQEHDLFAERTEEEPRP